MLTYYSFHRPACRLLKYGLDVLMLTYYSFHRPACRLLKYGLDVLMLTYYSFHRPACRLLKYGLDVLMLTYYSFHRPACRLLKYGLDVLMLTYYSSSTGQPADCWSTDWMYWCWLTTASTGQSADYWSTDWMYWCAHLTFGIRLYTAIVKRARWHNHIEVMSCDINSHQRHAVSGLMMVWSTLLVLSRSLTVGNGPRCAG